MTAPKKMAKGTGNQPPNDPNILRVTHRAKTKSQETMSAETAYDPAARSLAGARAFITNTMGKQALTESLEVLMTQVAEVRAGNMAIAEKTLVAQANTLDAIFNELARRAALNMGEYLGATENYMRLALKAQSQCRATLEALATIKNPPIMGYVKQANIAHGPQQVNNGNSATTAKNDPGAGKNENPPNKLLEEQHGQRLDSAAASTASGDDTTMATVGKIDRPKKRRGQSEGGA